MQTAMVAGGQAFEDVIGAGRTFALTDGRRLVVNRLDEGCYRWTVLTGWAIDSQATADGEINRLLAAAFGPLLAGGGL